MSMLLAEGAGNNVWNYVLIAVVALMLIALPILMNQRNKRESQKVQEQTNSLKVGDKVLTTSGVYGTITEINFDDTQKMVVIETGGKTKSYLSVDAYAIYTVFKSEEELAREAEAKVLEVKKDEKTTEEKVEQKPAEVVEVEVEKVEEPKKARKPRKKIETKSEENK